MQTYPWSWGVRCDLKKLCNYFSTYKLIILVPRLKDVKQTIKGIHKITREESVQIIN